MIYGAAAPTLAILDPKNRARDLEVGPSLAAGLKLPLGSVSHYDIESRFGFGDIPQFRLLPGVLFGGEAHSEPRTEALR